MGRADLGVRVGVERAGTSGAAYSPRSAWSQGRPGGTVPQLLRLATGSTATDARTPSVTSRTWQRSGLG